MKLNVFSSLLVAAAAAVTGCGLTGGYNLPPASQMMEPGPGVGGPGPGVLAMPSPGVAPASYTSSYGPTGGSIMVASPASNQKVQILFARPEAMQISYDVSGTGTFDSIPLVTPARQNFFQGGVYRLKLTEIPGREGTELYPTLEIGPTSRRTLAYLAHNAIPIQFTEQDFDQVMTGNFVTKVIYLPDPDFQELALARVETLVSTRLDPGMDPILEADRRGAILAVVRIGNKDMEIPGAQDTGFDTVATRGTVARVGYSQNAVAQTGFLRGAACNDGCDACVVGGGVAGCSDAACGGCGGACAGSCRSGAGYYGPNSTPRGGYGPGGRPAGLAGAGQYGMPITGTPIGLPGPPHVPLGVPAGLKKHVMRNWTQQHIPDPVAKLQINVKQRPGLSYPQPPSRAWVIEDTIHSQPHYSQQHFGVAPRGLPTGGGVQAGGAGHARHAPGGLLAKLKHAWASSHH